MVSVETMLRMQGRRLNRLVRLPGVRLGLEILGAVLGALFLAAGAVRQQMQPAALGLIAGLPGWLYLPAAVGAAAGYRLFWGTEGLVGLCWCLGASTLRWSADNFYHGDSRAGLLAVGTGVFVGGLGFVLWTGPGDLEPILRNAALAFGSVWLFVRTCTGGSILCRALLWGLALLTLGGIPASRYLHPALFAAGALAAAGSLPAMVMAGLGLELSGVTEAPMTGAMAAAAFFRLLPLRNPERRALAPVLGCLGVLGLSGRGEWMMLIPVAAGAALGALIPADWEPLGHHTGTGAAQVRLEQLSRALGTLQGTLLELSPPEPDAEAVAEHVRENACGTCPCREGCKERERITGALFRDPFALTCRRSGRLLAELRRGRDQLRQMQADRRRLEDYRRALAGQYAFLGDALRTLADGLGRNGFPGQLRFHLQASARSRGKSAFDGDRCAAFPGTGAGFFVLLCDGMGTGAEAARAAEEGISLLRRFLRGGVPPQHALGCLDAQLTLRGEGGLVTADLLELRLDTGQAALYKWGSAPSVLLRRGKAETIGVPTPPPGTPGGRERTARFSMGRGEVVLLLSDGAALPEEPGWAEQAQFQSAAALADRIVARSPDTDDATAAVIRLLPLKGR